MALEKFAYTAGVSNEHAAMTFVDGPIEHGLHMADVHFKTLRSQHEMTYEAQFQT